MKRDTLIHFLKTHLHDQTRSLSAEAKARLKTRVLQNLRVAPTPQSKRMHEIWGFTYTRFALATLSVVVLLSGTAYASSAATPGDILYPVKRAMEDTRVRFASNSETRAKLQVQFTEERLHELETIALKAPLKMKVTPTIQADPTAATPSTSATGTPAAAVVGPEPDRETTPAENSAREEVNKALRKLEKTRDDLSKQGNTVAAYNLAKTINLLSGRMSKKERENSDQKQNDGRVKGSSRIPEKDSGQTEPDPNQDDTDSAQRRLRKN